MKKSGDLAKKEPKEELTQLDDIFENFRREVETALRPWQSGFGLPSLFDSEIRVPLCDMTDKGAEYQLNIEVPGIEKEKINVKATPNSLEVSADQSEKAEEKKKDYVYSERSHRSFYRKISVPEEIVPSKIEARMNNGVLVVTLPKKTPSKGSGEATRVEVK